MKEEVVLMLSELRSQIDDTIRRVEKESAAESKEIMSTLNECEYILLGSYLIFPQHFFRLVFILWLFVYRHRGKFSFWRFLYDSKICVKNRPYPGEWKRYNRSSFIVVRILTQGRK